MPGETELGPRRRHRWHKQNHCSQPEGPLTSSPGGARSYYVQEQDQEEHAHLMTGVTGTGSTPAPAHQYVEVVRHTRVVVCSRVVWSALVYCRGPGHATRCSTLRLVLLYALLTRGFTSRKIVRRARHHITTHTALLSCDGRHQWATEGTTKRRGSMGPGRNQTRPIRKTARFVSPGARWTSHRTP